MIALYSELAAIYQSKEIIGRTIIVGIRKVVDLLGEQGSVRVFHVRVEVNGLHVNPPVPLVYEVKVIGIVVRVATSVDKIFAVTGCIQKVRRID